MVFDPIDFFKNECANTELLTPYAKKDYLGVTKTLRLKKKKPAPSELEQQHITLSERIKN